jgi:CRP/FNR family transcriptional regulator, cyclic AMP receptor protein
LISFNLYKYVELHGVVIESDSMQQASATFDPRLLFTIVDGARKVMQYRKGDVLFAQGDRSDAVFYIQQGKIKITVLSEQGKEAVVAFQGVGDFCGEGCLTGQKLRIASAVAIEPCVAVRIEKAAVVSLLHEDHAFSELFVTHLLARNIRVEADLVDQLFNSSEKRLARLLLLLANFGKEGRPEPILANITQETLAEMIGTTRSRVSLFMNKFRKLGLIEYNGHIEVHSSLLNAVLHDIPQITEEGAP